MINFSEYCMAKQLKRDADDMYVNADTYEESQLALKSARVAKLIIETYLKEQAQCSTTYENTPTR